MSAEMSRFVCVSVALLLPMLDDKRDRTAAAYRAWEQKLAEDIKDRGQREPILVVREGKGFRVLAGETRRRCLILMGSESALVQILERQLTRREALREQLLENRMRKSLTPTEEIEICAELLAETQGKQVDLARECQVNASTLNKAISYSLHLPDDLRAKLGKGEGKLGSSIAYHISRLHVLPDSHNLMRQIAERHFAGRLKRDSLVKEVNKAIGKAKHKEPTIKYAYKGATWEIPKGWNHDRFLALCSRLFKKTQELKANGKDLSELPDLLKADDGTAAA